MRVGDYVRFNAVRLEEKIEVEKQRRDIRHLATVLLTARSVFQEREKKDETTVYADMQNCELFPFS